MALWPRACRGSGVRVAHASDRPGILAALIHLLRTRWDVSFRQLRVQRRPSFRWSFPISSARSCGRLLRGRRPRAELHVHGCDPAADGVHRRHPARQPARHLLYKALFEMSADRADFLSRLFSRRARLAWRVSTVEELFSALATSPATEARYRDNLNAVRVGSPPSMGCPVGRRLEWDRLRLSHRLLRRRSSAELSVDRPGRGGGEASARPRMPS